MLFRLLYPTDEKAASLVRPCVLLLETGSGSILASDLRPLYLGIDTPLVDAYNEPMRFHFKPKTKLGRCSAWLIVAFAIFFGSLQALIASGQRGGDTFFSNLVLAIPGVLAASSGIAAFVTGLISIVRRRERSMSVYLAVGFGLITLIFVLGELIFPQ